MAKFTDLRFTKPAKVYSQDGVADEELHFLTVSPTPEEIKKESHRKKKKRK